MSPNTSPTRFRSQVEQHYGEKSLPKRVYNKVRGSFLIMGTIFGIVIFAIGAGISFGINEQIWGPVIGASGVVIALVHVLLYLGYLFIDSRY